MYTRQHYATVNARTSILRSYDVTTVMLLMQKNHNINASVDFFSPHVITKILASNMVLNNLLKMR